jgi:iron complex outermembrane receptor protein
MTPVLRTLFVVGVAMPGSVLAGELPPGGHGVEEILTTARPFGQSDFDAVQGTAVLTGEDLFRRVEGTLGDTLDALPGVSSSYFGPGASRPVIRGLGGGRVRVLTGGIGSIDASTTSPDHALAIEPLTLGRIEVVRGPATLLYGSSAVGGVVNVFDNRIPVEKPEQDISGGVRAGYATANDGWEGQAEFNVGLGPFVLHLDGFRRNTDDLEIPGYAESDALIALEGEEHEEGEKGILPNSDVDNKGGAVGLSYLFDTGFFGVSVSRNDMNYGIPGGHGHGHEEEEAGAHDEDGVRVDLNQTRFDLMGEVNRDMGLFDKAKLRFGYADYTHRELEGADIGTVFTNEGWEGRLELVQKQAGGLKGAVGVQMLSRDFAAIGDEAFVPPTDTFLWGLFVVEEYSLDAWTFEAGARIERQEIKAPDLGMERNFTGLSSSVGVAYDLDDQWRVSLSGARSERLPGAEELFSNGPHVATAAYEVGNPDLGKEVAWSGEFSIKKRVGRVTGSVNLFYNRFNGFIYEAFTGREVDDLRELEFRQADAEFWGGEAELDYVAYENRDIRTTLSLSADMVRANLLNPGEPLPRIPPRSMTAGVEVLSRYVDGTLELQMVDDQSRTAPFELRTGGYALVNASLSFHPFPDDADLTLSLIARNLGDTEARSHTSFLKDLAPRPGRDIRFVALYRF